MLVLSRIHLGTKFICTCPKNCFEILSNCFFLFISLDCQKLSLVSKLIPYYASKLEHFSHSPIWVTNNRFKITNRYKYNVPKHTYKQYRIKSIHMTIILSYIVWSRLIRIYALFITHLFMNSIIQIEYQDSFSRTVVKVASDKPRLTTTFKLLEF